MLIFDLWLKAWIKWLMNCNLGPLINFFHSTMIASFKIIWLVNITIDLGLYKWFNLNLIHFME